jgi:hypothetical protein
MGISEFAQLHPIWQALLATCFTWFLTAAGSAMVFTFGVMAGFAVMMSLDVALG